jgi:hypothetical protein
MSSSETRMEVAPVIEPELTGFQLHQCHEQ